MTEPGGSEVGIDDYRSRIRDARFPRGGGSQKSSLGLRVRIERRCCAKNNVQSVVTLKPRRADLAKPLAWRLRRNKRLLGRRSASRHPIPRSV